MDNVDQFYMTLPSSASMDLYPSNKISSFTTELLNTIYLERETYEVGLTEIILDTDIENVTGKQIAFVIYRNVNYVKKIFKNNVPKGLVQKDGVKYYQEIFYTKGGLYKSLSEITSYFNIKFLESRICKDLIFYTTKADFVDIITLKSLRPEKIPKLKTFHIQPYTWFQNCILSSNNRDVSDVEIHETDNKNTLTYFRRYIPSFDEHASRIGANISECIIFICNSEKLLRHPGPAYIYSDLVEYQTVGNTKSPILRVVQFPLNTKTISFNHIHYIPLAKSYISNIHVYTRDVEGNAFPFTRGTAVFKLHFRKKSI